MEWSPPLAPVLIALAALVAVVALVVAWQTATPAARRPLLLVLRAAALGVLLLILLGPAQVSRTEIPGRPPRVVVLLDSSRSMALEAPSSRLDQAQTVLRDARERVEAGRRARLDVFEFGSELAAVSNPAALTADANETRLRTALEQLAARLGDDPPRSVVLLSDGRSTGDDDPIPLADGYRRLGVPIHVVPVGDARATGDVAVQDLVAPRTMHPGAKVPVRIVIRAVGLAGRRAEVQVRSLTDPGRKVLAGLPVTLAVGETAVDLVLDPGSAAGDLLAEVPPVEGETILDNNRVPFRIAPRDPKVRVIYMEGTGNNEYRFLRDALVEDPAIECLAMEVDYQYNRVQRLHRIGEPGRGYPTTREELFSYDVVICSDISRFTFTPDQLAWTVELVANRGGGFAMIGGNTSFGAGFWDQTVWDKLIPVDMSGPRTGGNSTLWNVRLKTVVPPEAEDHPIWRIVDDPDRNRAILARIPTLLGSNLTDRLKPAATLLGHTSVAVSGVGLMPLFSCQSYGRGRSFAMSSDTTVDWGRDFERLWGEGDNRYFRKFWRNVVRWLAENSEGSTRRLRVETDRLLYRPGDRAVITARAFDEKREETRSYRLVARFPGSPEARDVTLLPSASGPYQAELTVPAPGPDEPPSAAARPVKFQVTAYEQGKSVAQVDVDLQRVDDSPEYRDPRPDHAQLATLARRSGGQTLHDAAELAHVLTADARDAATVSLQRTPAWDRAPLWLLLLALLLADWVLRRARGLA
jgi:uncharacterized membrane protein